MMGMWLCVCGKDDDSYLGYSVTTGEFNGDGDKLDVAVGMPRGANLTGKVTFKFHIFTEHGQYPVQILKGGKGLIELFYTV